MEAKGDIDREPRKHSGRGSLEHIGSHYVLHWEYQWQSTITECETVLCTTDKYTTASHYNSELAAKLLERNE